MLDLGCGRYRKLGNYTPEANRKASLETGGHLGEDEKHPYDIVEVRNNAWRTHGIDNVEHTERKDKKGAKAECRLRAADQAEGKSSR